MYEEELAAIIRDTAATGGKIIIPAFAWAAPSSSCIILHNSSTKTHSGHAGVTWTAPLPATPRKYSGSTPNAWTRDQPHFHCSPRGPFRFSRLKIHSRHQRIQGAQRALLSPLIASLHRHVRSRPHSSPSPQQHRKFQKLVLFVGYAAKETLARKLMDGNRVVRIFGMEHTVRSG